MVVVRWVLVLFLKETPMNFYNDVNDWLSVGGDLDLARSLTGMEIPDIVQEMRARGVTHVLDLRIEWEDRQEWEDGGLASENYAHVPIIDSWGHQPPADWFDAIEAFVQRFLVERSEGDRLYVHCHMGINRGPSAAMAALLLAEPDLDPWDAFLAIRGARAVAGLVYAEAVGIRHIAKAQDNNDQWLSDLAEFRTRVKNYWTPERIAARRRGVAYYRSAEGGTLVAGHEV
jgi:hypothetical protein